jgi:hypothetical protein
VPVGSLFVSVSVSTVPGLRLQDKCLIHVRNESLYLDSETDSRLRTWPPVYVYQGVFPHGCPDWFCAP